MTESITFETLPAAALKEWIQNTTTRYIDERIAGGDSRAEAEANAYTSTERLFPKGSLGPGQLVGRLMSSSRTVGSLWIGWAGTDPQRWWVWNVMIDEGFRGQGFGRQALLLAESLARREGALTIGLNVAGRNHIARSLYTSLGYQETAVQMRKALDPVTN